MQWRVVYVGCWGWVGERQCSPHRQLRPTSSVGMFHPLTSSRDASACTKMQPHVLGPSMIGFAAELVRVLYLTYFSHSGARVCSRANPSERKPHAPCLGSAHTSEHMLTACVLAYCVRGCCQGLPKHAKPHHSFSHPSHFCWQISGVDGPRGATHPTATTPHMNSQHTTSAINIQ